MNTYFVALVLVVFYVGWSNAAGNPIRQCSGENFDDLKERIQVLPCGKSKCRLKKGTNVTVNFRFKPKNEVTELSNIVYANVAGIPLPFVGVYGVSACGNIKTVDGTPTACPLQANEEYIYSNTFPVLKIYPSIDVTVHWALHGAGHAVICFEVPAVIV